MRNLLPNETNTAAPAADVRELASTWRTLVTSDAEIARSYLEHLVEKIVVHDSRIAIVPKPRHVEVEAKEVVTAV